MTTSSIALHILPITQVRESRANPRKRFDPEGLLELTESIRQRGIQTPLLVRPTADGFEIAAGHRRYRAAKAAGITEIPAIVRLMDDPEFLELITFENLEREDVHPLEQAEGYKRLMLLDGYDAKRIAERIWRSEKWVYDRLKLLQLTPKAQQLFLAGKMTAGHAILLARLSAKDQERALEVPENGYNGARRGGLWQDEHGGDLFEDEIEEKKTKGKPAPLAEFDGYKPVSVRELDHWISDHVRFDPKAADPVLFPAVVEAVAEAPKPLVPITILYKVPDEARDGTVRTYGPTAWKRADGTKAGKACDYAVPAVVAVGPGRGETFPVCLRVNIERCATHWAKEKRELEQRRKQNEKGTSTRRVDNTYEKQQERRKAEEARRGVVQARYKAAAPALVKAIATAIDKAPLARLGKALLEYVRVDRWTAHVLKVEDFHRMGGTAEGILRHLAFLATVDDCSVYRLEETMTVAGKTWGVDVKAILDKEAPAPKPEKPAAAAAAKPKKKAGKK